MASDAGAAPAPAAAASSVADVLAADDSWHTSVEMSLAWLLLAMAVLATYFIQRLRIGAHLPPSAVAMCIGIAVGGVLLALPGPQQQLVFEPEFFFFGLLPPVIFNAGFQLKKKGFMTRLYDQGVARVTCIASTDRNFSRRFWAGGFSPSPQSPSYITSPNYLGNPCWTRQWSLS